MLFWNTSPAKDSDFSSNNKLDELKQLKSEAQAALEEHNQIVANLWTIKYQLTVNAKTLNNNECSDKKNKLEDEKKTLELLLKDNCSSEKIDLLYNKIANIEKELDSDFNREEPYFIY